MAYFNRVIHFGTGKALRRIFIAYVYVGRFHKLIRQLFNKSCAVYRNIDNARHILFKYDLALKSRCGIVKVYYNVLCALYSLKGLFDKMLAALHKHLNCHIVRNIIPVYKRAENFIFRLRCGRKADLDFLYADVYKRFEHLKLLLKVHGVYKSLISVAEIHRAPNRRLFYGLGRPSSVRNVDRFKRNVLVCFHNHFSYEVLQSYSLLCKD